MMTAFSDMGFGQYLVNSVMWLLAGVGIGYIMRDVIDLAKTHRGES